MSFSPNNTSAPGQQAAQDAMRASESGRLATPDMGRLSEIPMPPGPITNEIQKVLDLLRQKGIVLSPPGGPNVR